MLEDRPHRSLPNRKRNAPAGHHRRFNMAVPGFKLSESCNLCRCASFRETLATFLRRLLSSRLHVFLVVPHQVPRRQVQSVLVLRLRHALRTTGRPSPWRHRRFSGRRPGRLPLAAGHRGRIARRSRLGHSPRSGAWANPASRYSYCRLCKYCCS